MTTLCLFLGISLPAAEGEVTAQVAVYGGTPSGLMAAVAAARVGERVVLVEPTKYLGGVVTGGLTYTDIGRSETIGGYAWEFFGRVKAYYESKYGPDSPQVAACRNGFFFEPHVAEAVFEVMVAEQPGITVLRQHRIAMVVVQEGRITALILDHLPAAGRVTLRAEQYIDATYEGDLMAFAGVPYRVGREGQYEFGEEHAGNTYPPEERGQPDQRLQAYNFRLCLTDDPALHAPILPPPQYDPAAYRLAAQYIQKHNVREFDPYLLSLGPLPNRKYDGNNGYAWLSTDWVGQNYAYPGADFNARAVIAQAHLEYIQGLLYFLQNDPSLPEELRQESRRFSLARDEFEDAGHWPRQMYIREARRMVGRYVLREQDVRTERYKPDAVAVGSYPIDSHGVQRFFREEGPPFTAGELYIPVLPYEIPYRCLVPEQISNLLVTVCCSATHVAYCTVRMEPVYMMLGHAAGVAAHLARTGSGAVQEVDPARLQSLLREQGQVLEAPYWPVAGFTATPTPEDPFTFTFTASPKVARFPIVRWWWDFEGDGSVEATEETVTHTFPADGTYSVGLLIEDAKGQRSEAVYQPVAVGAGGPAEVVVEEGQAAYGGSWMASASVWGAVGLTYRHDRNVNKGMQWARFQPNLPAAGRWLVCIAYTPHPNRASNVPYRVFHRNGETVVTWDQRTRPSPFPFVPLGEFEFEAGTAGSVLVETAGTNGYVVVDAVKWIWRGRGAEDH